MAELTKAELIEKVASLEAELATKGVSMKTRVRDLLDNGVNCMDELASSLNTSKKNISSLFTSIRKDLATEGKTIITQQYNGKMRVAVVELSVLGW